MKHEPNWTDAVRDRLRDAETPPPTDGWERLRRELSATAAPAGPAIGEVRDRRLGAWRWRTAAAAAIVALCIGAGELLRRTVVEPQHPGPQLALSNRDEGPKPVPETFATEESAPERTDTPTRNPSRSRTSASEASAVAALTPRNGLRTAPASSDTKTASTIHPKDETATQQSENGAHSGSPETQAPRQGVSSDELSGTAARRTAYAGHETTVRRPARKTTSLALFAGGGVSARLDGTAPNGLPQQSSNPTWGYNNVGTFGSDRISLARKEDYRNSDFRHRQPLSAGFSIRKEFSHGLSLESGLTYTLRRSDVRMPYSAEELRQRLHFIGVPLRVNWRFVEQHGFSLYLGAGGMVEKCVSARLGDSSVSEKALQWSLAAAVGAEYRFAGPVGLYFEPDLSYYLTSTTSRTIRTESPLTFSLRLGLRLSF